MITKVIRIRSLGTINATTQCHGNPFNSSLDIHSGRLRMTVVQSASRVNSIAH